MPFDDFVSCVVKLKSLYGKTSLLHIFMYFFSCNYICKLLEERVHHEVVNKRIKQKKHDKCSWEDTPEYLEYDLY